MLFILPASIRQNHICQICKMHTEDAIHWLWDNSTDCEIRVKQHDHEPQITTINFQITTPDCQITIPDCKITTLDSQFTISILRNLSGAKQKVIFCSKKTEIVIIRPLVMVNHTPHKRKYKPECDKYFLKTKYEYQILFVFQKSPKAQYWILFRILKIQIPNKYSSIQSNYSNTK